MQLSEMEEMIRDPDVNERLIITLSSSREFVLEFQTLHDQELFRWEHWLLSKPCLAGRLLPCSHDRVPAISGTCLPS